MKMGIYSLALTLALLASTGAAWAQYDLGWWTVDGGGAMFTAGGTFELSGTIGQPDANAVLMIGGTFELSGGFWPGAAPSICRGDCNCDGNINFADINAFVAVLQNPSSACSFDNCDVDGSGAINFADINALVDALQNHGGPCP
jgi:hypothetical protein